MEDVGERREGGGRGGMGSNGAMDGGGAIVGGGAMVRGGAMEGAGEMEGGVVWSDGGRGTNEAYLPGLMVTHVHSWMLGHSPSFVGICLHSGLHFYYQVFVFICAQSCSWVMFICGWFFSCMVTFLVQCGGGPLLVGVGG